MKLLHIDSSIQGDASASRAITAAIAAEIQASNPEIQTTYRDLVREPIAHLTLEAFADQSVCEEFLAADVVVIGAGMYNFGIPSQLKAWIDRIAVAGKTFRYGANGPEGLAGGKRVVIVMARGGVYGDGTPARALEYAETYLRSVFGFIGIANPEVIVAEGLALGDDARNGAMEAALKHGKEIGSGLAVAA